MNYFDEWKQSWLDLFGNLKLLIPDVVFIILSGLIGFVILQVSGLFPIIKTVYIDRDFTIISNVLVRTIISVVLFVVTTFVLGAGIRAVKYNFIKDVIKKKKVDLSKFFSYSNKDVFRVVSVRVLLFLVFFVLMLIIGLVSGLFSFVLSKELIALATMFILGLASIIYSFSILFVYPLMFLKGESPWKSIKISFEYFKKKTKHVVFVWLIIILTSYAITNIISYVFNVTGSLQLVVPVNIIGILFIGVWGLIYLFRAL
jgi:membrane-anchored glycerophosphoryl diester phosphodiesterase (GDPDase)